jgi:hypothetical protein
MKENAGEMYVLQRLCFLALFASAVGAFAASLRVPVALVFLVPAVVALFWHWTAVPGFVVSTAKRLLVVFLLVTLILGWILMAFPILSMNAVRTFSLIGGLGLAFLGSLFFLGRSVWSPWTTFIPATMGVLVVACFRMEAPLVPYVVAAGAAAFVYLAFGLSGRLSFQRLASLAASGLVVLGVVSSIFWFLPWAQGYVEQAMVDLYVGGATAISGQGTARLGDMAKLKLSRKVVLRMWSSRPVKLRGQVLTRFDGSLWSASPKPTRLAPSPSVPLRDDLRHLWEEIPGNDFELYANDAGSFIKIVRADSGTGSMLVPKGTAMARAGVDQLFVDPNGILTVPMMSSVRLYGLTWGTRPVSLASREELEEALGVPANTDPRLIELAEQLSKEAESPRERIFSTAEYVSSACHYSLDVGEFTSDQPVAEFLFEKKRGWCQFFASATAVLLRLQGVPARYVGGFNVIPSNRVGDHYVVRESDSHAWVEAYVPEQGWVEVDPTPAAEYEELHADLGGGRLKETLESLKARFSELWLRFLIGDWWYLLRPLVSLLWKPWLWLLVAVMLLATTQRFVRQWWTARRKRALVKEAESRPIAAELIQWLKELDSDWKKQGWPRPPNRAPLEHLLQLPKDDVSAETFSAARQVIDCYYRAAFRGDDVSAEELEALRQRIR